MCHFNILQVRKLVVFTIALFLLLHPVCTIGQLRKINFTNGGTISSGSFAPKVDFATGVTPLDVAIGDLDGDGKPDLVVANYYSNTVSVFRNTSNTGSITGSSFAAKVDFITGNGPHGVVIGDLDGDGKPDLVVTNYQSNTISVFRNTSTIGSITSTSFAPKVDFVTDSYPFIAAIGDLDNDGKPDFVVTNYHSDLVSVFHNTSTAGSITSSSFATKVDFATSSYPLGIAIGDLDGDGKPDLAVTNASSNTVSVFKNTCSIGSINDSSFAAGVDFATGSYPFSLAIGDLDGDGKLDITTANYSSNTVSVIRNTSTVGNLTESSFAAKVDYATDSGPYYVAISDLNGDGKPDLTVTNSGSNTISVFQNTSVSGSITSSSFTSRADFSAGSFPYYIAIGDLDGDGKPDLVVTNQYGNTISVFRNIIGAPYLTAIAGNGQVTLTWSKYSETNFLRYRIYLGTTSPASTQIDSTTGDANDTTCLITGLTNGTKYYFRVTAVDSSGKEGEYSNEVSAVPFTVYQGLAVYYPFSGNANDASGNGFNGTVYGAMLTADRFNVLNSAYDFNGFSNYILCGDILDVVFSAPVAKFTVSGWAKTRTCGSFVYGGGFIIGKNAGGTYGPYQWSVSHDDGLVVASVFSDTAMKNFIELANPMSTNQWFHFVLVFDGSLPEMQQIKLSVNGQSSNSVVRRHVGTLGTTTVNSQQHLTIGACHIANAPLSPANFYDGDIDDIRIYNRALSDTEIQALYHEGGWIGPPSPPQGPIFHITSIQDVPNDQGKSVSVVWRTFEKDTLQPFIASHYSVWRRDTATVWTHVWELPSRNDSLLSVVVPTLFDSTKVNGMHWSTFQVTAHSIDLTQIAYTPIDSGYSVDNLAPGAPSKIQITLLGKDVVINWEQSRDGDFCYFAIYRTTTAGQFPQGMLPYKTTTQPTFTDIGAASGQIYYYRISSIDFSGNESKLSQEVSTIMVDVNSPMELPKQFLLYCNYPNPFNPSTKITYDVPEESFVTLTIFDVLGREVTTLIDSRESAGHYSVPWNGHNSANIPVTSGVYLYRLNAKPLSATKPFIAFGRMVIMR